MLGYLDGYGWTQAKHPAFPLGIAAPRKQGNLVPYAATSGLWISALPSCIKKQVPPLRWQCASGEALYYMAVLLVFCHVLDLAMERIRTFGLRPNSLAFSSAGSITFSFSEPSKPGIS